VSDEPPGPGDGSSSPDHPSKDSDTDDSTESDSATDSTGDDISHEGDSTDERAEGASETADDPDEPRDSITEGHLARPLFRLAWPIVVVQLLQVAYNIADTIYLGRLSADAVGAISLALPVILLLISVAGGFTSAGSILVAQYTGAEGDRSAGLVAGQTVGFVGFLSVVIAIVGVLFTEPALALLPSDPETAEAVIPLAVDYIEIIFLGMPLLFGFFVFTALMRGYGNTRIPMVIMVLSVAVNVFLDPFFIFGFEGNPLFEWFALTGLESSLLSATGFTGWGIEGAAIATIFSRGLAAGLGIWLLFGTAVGPATTLSHLRPDFEFIEDIVRLGIPTMVEQSMSALALITLTAMVVTFTPPVVAAYGLGNRIISLVYLPALGLGRAIDTMVGQNLGAEKPDRAARSVWLAAGSAAGVMLLVAVVAAVLIEPIVSVFLGDVPDAVATIGYGIEYLRIRSVEFAFIGVTQVMLGAFRGAGNTKVAMIISVITLWVGRVGTVFLLVFGLGWGPSGIWIGMAVGNILGTVVSIPWFLRGTWRERYIDDEQIESTYSASAE